MNSNGVDYKELLKKRYEANLKAKCYEKNKFEIETYVRRFKDYVAKIEKDQFKEIDYLLGGDAGKESLSHLIVYEKTLGGVGQTNNNNLMSFKDKKEKASFNDVKEVIKKFCQMKDLYDEDAKKYYNNFTSQALLGKILNIRSFDEQTEFRHKLLPFTSDDATTFFYKILDMNEVEDKEKTVYQKNAKILEKAKEVLNEQQPLNNEIVLTIYQSLWDIYSPNAEVLDEVNCILYGPPGTGKTYGIKDMLDKIGIDGEQREKVQFHPNFTYEDFIEGIKPTGITSDGKLKLSIVNGCFKNFCIRAKKDIDEYDESNDKQYYFICDEINRANVAQVFGECLSLLEKGYRDYNVNDKKNERNLLKTPLSETIKSMIFDSEEPIEGKIQNYIDNFEKYKNYIYQFSFIKKNADSNNRIYYEDNKDGSIDKSKLPSNIDEWKTIKIEFGIPRNVHFIGMMNDVDKSIDSFDLAFRRRFTWIKKNCDYEVLKNELVNPNKDGYVKSCKELNKKIIEQLHSSSYEFGHSYFLKIDDYAKRGEITEEHKEKLFTKHIEPVLREYLRMNNDDESIIDKSIKDEYKAVFKGENKKTSKTKVENKQGNVGDDQEDKSDDDKKDE